MPSRSVPRSLFVLAGLLALALLAGCRGVAKIQVTITGEPITAETRPAVDVRNWRGSVTIVADSSIERATVHAKALPRVKGSPKGDELAAQTFVAAESTVQDGRATLRVVAESRLADPDVAEARLVIRVPSCGGVMVQNAGGVIEVRGIGGAVTIENGTGNRAGGRVIVRTDQVMREPVSITTSNGKVHYQVPPGSSGQFDLRSDDGTAVMYAMSGSLTVRSAGPNYFQGTLNGGENPVVIRTGRGKAEVYVIETAGAYRPTKR